MHFEICCITSGKITRWVFSYVLDPDPENWASYPLISLFYDPAFFACKQSSGVQILLGEKFL